MYSTRYENGQITQQHMKGPDRTKRKGKNTKNNSDAHTKKPEKNTSENAHKRTCCVLATYRATYSTEGASSTVNRWLWHSTTQSNKAKQKKIQKYENEQKSRKHRETQKRTKKRTTCTIDEHACVCGHPSECEANVGVQFDNFSHCSRVLCVFVCCFELCFGLF